eukprot:3829853-Rhodomonas_salina.2
MPGKAESGCCVLLPATVFGEECKVLCKGFGCHNRRLTDAVCADAASRSGDVHVYDIPFSTWTRLPSVSRYFDVESIGFAASPDRGKMFLFAMNGGTSPLPVLFLIINFSTASLQACQMVLGLSLDVLTQL